MSEFKGKTISVITTDDIRYVGVLDDIDGEKGTLSLIEVKILGTEDRVLDAQKVQFPQTRTYPALQLGGQDVKELNILDLKVENVQAIPIPKSVLQKLLPEAATTVTKQQQEPKKENDFDFETNNSKFDKEKLLDQENGEENDDGAALYDKKVSFFDNLSSSNDENGRLSWSEERSMNVDTFGKSSLRRGGNRGRGGRGRGGRGGRGRGNRGGSNNFTNNNKKTPEWAF